MRIPLVLPAPPAQLVPGIAALALILAGWIASALAITPAELEARFKQLPTVPESDLPELPNEPTSFRGLIEHEGLEGHTWVSFPFVENPGSFGFDRKGRLFVAEANRFWLGVPDLRGANELIRDDFRAVRVEDRTALYEKFAASFPEGWFERVADRIIRLEDRDGNGAADHRTLFSDRFKEPLDGIGFSVLADDGSIYYTCIPHVWKLTDSDDDGVADKEEIISTGYGVRVSFIGHDLHGVVKGPDGRLYFSVGDRTYRVTDGEGRVHDGAGRGAIFRCEPDGSGLEVFCTGLRNPQELAFDDHGNLFTFDNTGDIGDLARMVYALEGSDSGWNMAHQSPHHYATHLDWGEFRPEKSMWVAERMFDTWNEEQPQWVYPPASHVARGPSGVTWLTGESLPEDLRNTFLLANYRGPSENCTVLSIGIEPSGAGYRAVSEEIVVQGVGASDVELGFDGNLYLCDFGGGWSVNENGSIQVAKSRNPEHREAGAEVAKLFAKGFDSREIEELARLLSHPDKRVRQEAQFALVEHGVGGEAALGSIARGDDALVARLHATWGLGQRLRGGSDVGAILLALLEDAEPEVRANAARVLGDARVEAARSPLIGRIRSDDSPRVRSLAAIALGRACEPGDAEAVAALFEAAKRNGSGETDVVVRHSLLTALDRLATEEDAIARAESDSPEERLLAILALRRKASPKLALFLGESDPLLLREAVRAIHDTAALDSEAGDALAALDAPLAVLPPTVQRRVVSANYRRGTTDNARRLLELAARGNLDPSVRRAALLALHEWENAITTDPVLGHYRPLPETSGRELSALGEALSGEIQAFLAGPHDSGLIALALEFATAAGIELDAATLLSQLENRDLGPDLRVVVLDSLAQTGFDGLPGTVRSLLDDPQAPVRAAAMTHAFKIELDGTRDRAKKAIDGDALPVARAAIDGLSGSDLAELESLWTGRDKSLRPGLWLDAWLALSAKGSAAAAELVAGTDQVHALSLHGGDPVRGEVVFRNQGACLQCHKVGDDGGIQGPDLTAVAKRLSREKILESVWNPGAEIAEGYGMSTITLADGNSVVGRIARENDAEIVVLGLDGKETVVKRTDVATMAPPVSAMPPMAAALPPADLRDLVAYLAARKGGKGGDDASHGDDEKIAK